MFVVKCYGVLHLEKRTVYLIAQMPRRAAATYGSQNAREGAAHRSICRKNSTKWL